MLRTETAAQRCPRPPDPMMPNADTQPLPHAPAADDPCARAGMIRTDRVLVMDIDGTLAAHRQPGQGYADVGVVPAVVHRMRELKAAGWWIVLNTSRNMQTHGGNLGLILKHTAPVLLDWLARHDVPYDEIHFGKPWCGNRGFYVDDRAIRPREFATLAPDEIDALIRQDSLAR